MSTDPKRGSWDSCESVPWVRSDHLQHIWIMVYTKMSSYFFLPTIPFPLLPEMRSLGVGGGWGCWG